MAIVIKEIVVRTTVESERWREPEWTIPPEVLEQLKEEIWKEIERREYSESKRKER